MLRLMPAKQDTLRRVAIVGYTPLGIAIAKRCLQLEYSVNVYSPTANATIEIDSLGATACVTPKDTVHDCHYVISSAATEKEARDLWTNFDTGAQRNLTPGSLVIETTPATSVWMDMQARMALAKRKAFFEMGFAGGPKAIVRGRAQLFWHADDRFSKFESIEEFLKPFAPKIYECKDFGIPVLAQRCLDAISADDWTGAAHLLAAHPRFYVDHVLTVLREISAGKNVKRFAALRTMSLAMHEESKPRGLPF